MAEKEQTLRIAAIADIHVKKTSQGMMQPIFAKVSESADVLLICGDLTDYGTIEEARILVKDIGASLRVPAIAVLGNHDFESGKQEEITKMLSDAGVTMLDGDSHEIRGVGFAGVKGFGGGFGRRAIGSWGEDTIKTFVREGIDEALKLEKALQRLRTPTKIVVLHYAPIHATVEGEPPEIYPFLGCSRLEDPIDRYRAAYVFHGHAHRGTPEGKTKGNATVYNVAMPLMTNKFPDQPPFRIIEVPIAEAVLS
jgi:Icc-related predicted phosphoesterase